MMKRVISKIKWELRNAWELMKFYDEVGGMTELLEHPDR